MLQRLYNKLMLGVEIEHEKGCWLYKHRINSLGYGVVSFCGDDFAAHRAMYFLTTGEEVIDDIHHKCETKNCINPAHLEQVTPKEHTKRHTQYTKLKRQVMNENLPEVIEKALEE